MWHVPNSCYTSIQFFPKSFILFPFYLAATEILEENEYFREKKIEKSGNVFRSGARIARVPEHLAVKLVIFLSLVPHHKSIQIPQLVMVRMLLLKTCVLSWQKNLCLLWLFYRPDALPVNRNGLVIWNLCKNSINFHVVECLTPAIPFLPTFYS